MASNLLALTFVISIQYSDSQEQLKSVTLSVMKLKISNEHFLFIILLQELVFGDFGDLTGEEHAKIYNILHGQVHSSAKVEVSNSLFCNLLLLLITYLGSWVLYMDVVTIKTIYIDQLTSVG